MFVIEYDEGLYSTPFGENPSFGNETGIAGDEPDAPENLTVLDHSWNTENETAVP